jgi:hypothetical protein
MSKQTINIGASPNDGTGTPLRTSFDYCNQNFTELYTATGPSGNNIVCPGTLTVSAGTLALPSLTTTGDTNTGIYFPAADTIAFVEGGAEAMRINSAGNLVVNNAATITGALDAARLNVTGATIPANGVYLGSANNLSFSANSTLGMTLNSTGLGVGVSPSFKLHVQENASNVIARFTGSNANGSVIDIINTGTGGGSYKIGSNYTIGGAGEFAIYDSTAAATRLLISSTGNVGVGVTPSAGRGAIQLSAGVGFPATQVASSDANCLDDYEEGTFTPIDSSGAGLTFSTAAGTYTKIGRQVIVYYNVTFPSTASTALITIGGLPFAAATSPSVANPGSGSITFQTSSISNASFAIAPTASTITVFTLAGTAVTNVSASTFTIRASFHYITN